MDQKLRILMQNENLTASKLAEILEIKPAAVSHILSGRNKPSFELVCRLVTRFPHINPYWLLGDAQEMLNQNAQISTPEIQAKVTPNLFDFDTPKSEVPEPPKILESVTNPTFANSDVEKIIIVYRDQSFEVLRPKKS